MEGRILGDVDRLEDEDKDAGTGTGTDTGPGAGPTGSGDVGDIGDGLEFEVSTASRAWRQVMLPCEAIAVGGERVAEHLLGLGESQSDLLRGAGDEGDGWEGESSSESESESESVVLLRLGASTEDSESFGEHLLRGRIMLWGSPVVANQSGEMVAHIDTRPTDSRRLAAAGLVLASGTEVLLRRLDIFDAQADVALGRRPGEAGSSTTSGSGSAGDGARLQVSDGNETPL